MTGPDDKDPKPPTVDLVPVVRAGEAEQRMVEALHELAGAYLRVEGLALAVARGLDAKQ